MARYKVLTTSFIANKLLQPLDADGKPTIVEYDGDVGSNLELVGDDVGKGVEAPGGVYTHDVTDLA